MYFNIFSSEALDCFACRQLPSSCFCFWIMMDGALCVGAPWTGSCFACHCLYKYSCLPASAIMCLLQREIPLQGCDSSHRLQSTHSWEQKPPLAYFEHTWQYLVSVSAVPLWISRLFWGDFVPMWRNAQLWSGENMMHAFRSHRNTKRSPRKTADRSVIKLRGDLKNG